MPDTVAMTEPMEPGAGWSKEKLFEYIEQFQVEARQRALGEGVFLTKTRAGVAVDNLVSAPAGSSQLRKGDGVRSYVKVGKVLSRDFSLFIKHPTLFTLFAEELSKHYAVYASIRNPLAVLASWQTVDFPIYHGRQAMVERFDAALAKRIARLSERIDRQVEILSWMVAVYSRLGRERIIRYEDLIADTEGQLARMHISTVPVTHPIKKETIENRYKEVDLRPLATALRRIGPQVKEFYPDFDHDLDRYAK